MYGNKYGSAGGDADVTFPGGGHLTHSHTASWQHTMQTVGLISGEVVTGITARAKTASDNLAATTQAKNASDAATAQQALSNEAAKTAGQQANAVQLSTILKKGPPTPK